MKEFARKAGLKEEGFVAPIEDRIVDLRGDRIKDLLKGVFSPSEGGREIAEIGWPSVFGKVMDLEKDALIPGCKSEDGFRKIGVFP